MSGCDVVWKTTVLKGTGDFDSSKKKTTAEKGWKTEEGEKLLSEACGGTGELGKRLEGGCGRDELKSTLRAA